VSRPAAAAVLSLLGLAGFVLFYVMLVPPWGVVRPGPRVPLAPVAAAENAWTEYSVALADLHREAAPRWLGEAAAHDLTPEVLAYLGRHVDALAHLRTGATRARFGYFEEPPTVVTPVPDLQALRHLAELAAAEARRLREAGDPAGALALETAAYRHGTDLAQPDAGVLLPIVAAGCRRSTAAALFTSLAADAPAEALARAARDVAAEDARMPGAWQATSSEWRLVARTVEDGFLTSRDGPRSPAALRLRVYDSFLRQHGAVLEEARPLLEAWDFTGLQELDERLPKQLAVRAAPWRNFWLIDNLAARMVNGVVAPLSRPARLLYVDRANGAAFQVLAACRAYQISHGRLPEDPQVALAEAGIEWPLDPVTRRPAGYRLEAQGAVVWMAGFDGRDDGGREPYLDKVQAVIAPGTDLVYRIGEAPTPRPLVRAVAVRP